MQTRKIRVSAASKITVQGNAAPRTSKQLIGRGNPAKTND
jgi:hypothetical protein